MITGTTEHPKFLELAAELDIMPCYVAGILECLWNFTRGFCPQGNVGRFTDRAIARGLGYEGDAKKLIAALVNARWIDVSTEHRLIIHDWPDHCGLATHGKLARARLMFANGATPDVQSLHSSERTAFKEWLKTQELGTSTEKNEELPAPIPGRPLVRPLVSPRTTTSSRATRTRGTPPVVVAPSDPPTEPDPEPDPPAEAAASTIAQVLAAHTLDPKPPPLAILAQVIAAANGVSPADISQAIAAHCKRRHFRADSYGFWPGFVSEAVAKFKLAPEKPVCPKCRGHGVIYLPPPDDATTADIDAGKYQKPCSCQPKTAGAKA